MGFTKDSEEYLIFRDAYALAGEISEVERAGEEWANYIKRLGIFAKRYKSPLAIRMAEAILDYAIDIEAIKKTEVQK